MFGDMKIERAREWAANRLMGWARALRPAAPPGPAMGSWKDQWERVLLAQGRVDAVYSGRAEPEGTAGATYDVFTFFVTCHHLVDWVVSDAALPRSTHRKARSLVGRSADLSLCADLANRAKHCALTRSRTGDMASGPSGNDATVMIGTGAKHAFRVESGGIERDARTLAHSCVAEWKSFLAGRGLI